jgi:hypothetical protein
LYLALFLARAQARRDRAVYHQSYYELQQIGGIAETEALQDEPIAIPFFEPEPYRSFPRSMSSSSLLPRSESFGTTPLNGSAPDAASGSVNQHSSSSTSLASTHHRPGQSNLSPSLDPDTARLAARSTAVAGSTINDTTYHNTRSTPLSSSTRSSDDSILLAVPGPSVSPATPLDSFESISTNLNSSGTLSPIRELDEDDIEAQENAIMEREEREQREERERETSQEIREGHRLEGEKATHHGLRGSGLRKRPAGEQGGEDSHQSKKSREH